MKYLFIMTVFFMSACSASSISEDQISQKVAEDIKLALSKEDTRLYFLGGRAPNFPGLDVAEREQLIASCGKRIMENSTDFIDKNEDLTIREWAFQYAKEYNQKMKSHCPLNIK